jgi:putative ABC transport system permease protein
MWRDEVAHRLAGQPVDPDIVEELAEHLLQRYDELRGIGLSDGEAYRDVLAELDDADEFLRRMLDKRATRRERCSAPEPAAPKRRTMTAGVSTGEALRGFAADLRFALRLLRRNPGFACVVMVTLALGIGANTAVFSLLDHVLLRPLPFADQERLVRISETRNGINDGPSPLDVRDFARASRSFETLVAYDAWRKNVSGIHGSTQAEQMLVGLVPAEYFETYGIQPLLGRPFTAEENQFGKHYVTAISQSLWQERFNADPDVLGQTIRINDEPYTIVAVYPDAIPPSVEGRSVNVTVFTPFAPVPNFWDETNRGDHGYFAIGRLKPDVSIEQAQADLSQIASALAARYPVDRGIGVVVRPLVETRVGTLRPVLAMLMGAVTLVLLIACSNTASLLLARQAVRRRELAVRTALGATRTLIVRQLLAETLVLAALGGALGLLLAWMGCTVVARVHPARYPQLASSGIDPRIFAFTLTLSMVTGLIFGLAPALAGARVELADVLRQGGRTATAGTGGRRLRQLLVIAEIALSLMLAIGASLLTQSILRLERQDLGFRPDHLLKAHFYLPPVRYPDAASLTRFTDQFVDRVRALPDVRSITITTTVPVGGSWRQAIKPQGWAVSRIEDLPLARFGVTDASYTSTFGIPIVQGRDFTDADTEHNAPVALVNEEFVRRFLPNREPIGTRIDTGPAEALLAPAGSPDMRVMPLTIVGVIRNTKNRGLAEQPAPEIIGLFRQLPIVNYSFKDFVVRTTGDPYASANAIRAQLQAMDPDLPLAEISSMDDVLAAQVADRRFTTMLLAIFAVVGITLAIVGVYGVVSYLVAQRTQEIGVRVALGASRRDVLWLVLHQGLTTGLVGIGLGLIGAWAARQMLAQLVFGVSTLDAPTYLLAASLLLLVAVAASAIPARRALRVDPVTALRGE